MLPLLHLHGLSSGDFVPALEQFLGGTAGLSPATVTRLTKQWSEDNADPGGPHIPQVGHQLAKTAVPPVKAATHIALSPTSISVGELPAAVGAPSESCASGTLPPDHVPWLPSHPRATVESHRNRPWPGCSQGRISK